MICEQRQVTWVRAAVVVLIAASAACAHGTAAETSADPPRGAQAIASQTQGSARQSPRLDHLIPTRDSMGSMPRRFEWTAVPGADSYSVGIWNEVDMLLWRFDNIPTNTLDTPDTVRLEPGTYFWAISAVQQGEEIAASGLAAFVVRPSNP